MQFIDKAVNRVIKWESIDVTIPEMIDLVQTEIIEKASEKDLVELEKGMQKTFVLGVGYGRKWRYYPSSLAEFYLCVEYKTKDGSYENTAYAQFDTFYEGMFDKARLLDIIKNFICFSVEQAKSFKILAGYHQYFAVRKAVEKAIIATKTDGKGGVFWHTQGSGKSLSMVFYAHLLQEALDSPTIVVMTDRIDLDDQL